jgi:hypothetical protein
MIHRPIEAPMPPLDARWIIALWVAIHGMGAESGGDLILEADTVRATAANAILALTSQLDAETALAITTALDKLPGATETQSDARVEDSLKRLGIRLDDAGVLSVAGFGKIRWG